MQKHPDGLNLTTRMLTAAGLVPPLRVLDMGAGDGETVAELNALGFTAVGIDRRPAEGVTAGDMTALPFSDGSFDAVISECSFSVCGNAEGAFQEARRVLRPGGTLLLSDVYFKADAAPGLSLPCPATEEGWRQTASGFRRLIWQDCSEEWLQFIVHCIWNGIELGDCGYYRQAAKARAGYFLSVWHREDGE